MLSHSNYIISARAVFCACHVYIVEAVAHKIVHQYRLMGSIQGARSERDIRVKAKFSLRGNGGIKSEGGYRTSWVRINCATGVAYEAARREINIKIRPRIDDFLLCAGHL